MVVRLFGQRNVLGGGVHFSNFCDSLRSFSCFASEIEEVNVTGKTVGNSKITSQSSDVNIFFFPTIAENFVKGIKIKWAIFESDTPSASYLEYLNNSHAIWLPSNWAKNILIKSGISADKMFVIGEGVDPRVFHPFGRRFWDKSTPFKFYTCGKYENRKGYDELLEGFELAFGGRKDVVLVLKADYFAGDNNDKKASLKDDLSKRKLTNVFPVYGALPTNDMSLIYNNVNAGVFPSRAEGWGLPICESLACALPVITNNYSGQTEYLKIVRGLFKSLNYTKKEIDCPEFTKIWGVGGSWAVTDPEEVALALTEVYENYDDWVSKGVKASEKIRHNFSWERSVERAIKSLKDLGVPVGKALNNDWYVPSHS
jgi:glycosyltransferase involved in cell wall biosynthesis